jgi:hypothetical protein
MDIELLLNKDIGLSKCCNEDMILLNDIQRCSICGKFIEFIIVDKENYPRKRNKKNPYMSSFVKKKNGYRKRISASK